MYTCGLSWEGYRAIDVYIKTMSYGMPAPEVEGWWIVNWEKVWWQRDLLQPYDLVSVPSMDGTGTEAEYLPLDLEEVPRHQGYTDVKAVVCRVYPFV